MRIEFQEITTNLAAGAVRRDTLEGKEYLVAPVAMLAEGVHAGSHGPLYYPDDELAKNVESWNHRPIVISHPKINGRGVSACSPKILDKQRVGLLFNTTKDGKLRAEAWLDEERLTKVAPDVMAAIRSNRVVEVSTGLFTENEETPGEWQGQRYDAIARNFRPDHLAILVGEKGAYSVEKGGGLLRINAARSDDFFDGLVQSEFAFTGENPLTNSETVLNNARSVARKSYECGVLDTEAKMNKQEKVNRLIANRRTRWEEADRGFLMTLSDDQLDKADPIQSDDPATKVPDNQQVLDRPDTPQKAGAQSGQAQPAPGQAPTAPPQQPQSTPQPQQNPPTAPTSPPTKDGGDAPKQNAATWEQVYSAAPPRIREMISNGLAMHDREVQRLIGIITNSPTNTFRPEWLRDQTLEVLSGLAALATPATMPQPFATGPQPSYFGQAIPPGPTANAVEEEPLVSLPWDFSKSA